MGAFLIFLLQVLLAVLVTGLIFPIVLIAVPDSRSLGPAPFYISIAVVFLLLRLAWPRKQDTP
jgi:hypothetical protein